MNQRHVQRLFHRSPCSRNRAPSHSMGHGSPKRNPYGMRPAFARSARFSIWDPVQRFTSLDDARDVVPSGEVYAVDKAAAYPEYLADGKSRTSIQECTVLNADVKKS